MDYQHYSTDDFILDEQFQEWVFYPTPSATIFWKNFLRQYPEKIREVEEAKTRLTAIRFQTYPPDELAYQRIRNKLQTHTKTATPTRQIGDKTNLRRYWVAAACLALLLLAGIGVWFNHLSPPTYHTTHAETRDIWLPDSTLIVLNANSSVTLRDYETGSQREVWLEGEAFFEVTENKQRPFVVHTGELNVRVTGTSFNVANREVQTQVVLASGQVLLETDASVGSITMEPGDLVAYDKASRQIQLQKVIPSQYTAWRDRIYFFQDATLQEVAEVIEMYYGQKVQLDQDLSTLRFTAKVVMQAEVDTLLTLLSETFDLNITKKQNQIMITKEKP